MKKKFVIIANPTAGKLNAEEKLELLEPAAETLDTKVYGLETKSAQELGELAKELSQKHEILVVAGGDGTFGDVINAVPEKTNLGYFPLGSGNALITAMGVVGPTATLIGQNIGGKAYIRDKIEKVIKLLQEEAPKPIDLILVNENRKSLLASIGFEGHVIYHSEIYKKAGTRGLMAYTKAVITTLLNEQLGFNAEISIGSESFEQKILSVYASKHPFMGYGTRVLPEAKMDDAQLHLNIFTGLPNLVLSALNSVLLNNAISNYRTAQEVKIKTDTPQPLQLDGEYVEPTQEFLLRVLPKEVNLFY